VKKMRGGYDDLANAACGALVYANVRAKRAHQQREVRVMSCGDYDPVRGHHSDDPESTRWQRY
jgi:hypothetical protein